MAGCRAKRTRRLTRGSVASHACQRRCRWVVRRVADIPEQPIGRFIVASAEFERRLTAVRSDQWPWPTPCTEWNVRRLVNHMTRGNLNYAGLVRGGTGAEFLRLRDADALGTDPVGAYTRSAQECARAFAAPGTLGSVLDASRFAYLTTREHNRLARQQARTACAAALLRWIHAVITQQVAWDPLLIATGTKTPSPGRLSPIAQHPPAQADCDTPRPGRGEPEPPSRNPPRA